MERILFVLALLTELSVLFLAISTAAILLANSFGAKRMGALLAGKNGIVGMIGAAAVGAITPFCSCASVPVVAGFLRSGMPLPMVTTFLITSPLISPAVVALLATLAGPAYTTMFLATSLGAALFVGGLTYLVPHDLPQPPAVAASPEPDVAWRARIESAFLSAWRDYRTLLPVFVLAGVAAGLLHDNVAQDWIRANLSQTGWYMVPLAALLGLPIYASTAVLLPLGTTLYTSGVNLGVVTALIMGATGFSIPEAVMLQKILGGRLLALIGVAFTLAVIAIGYLFQALALLPG